MRALHRLSVLALAVASICGCSSTVTATDRVQVRFRNATTMTLSDISLQWPGGSMQSSQLAPGSVSSYEQHDGAYPYGALRVTANGSVRRVQPIDYFGAQPLAPGRYTYVISSSTALPDGIDLLLDADR